jgi:hypothetical protein
MNQNHEGGISIKGNNETTLRNHVIPEMGDVLMSPVTEGFIMSELVAHNDNDILCLVLTKYDICIQDTE